MKDVLTIARESTEESLAQQALQTFQQQPGSSGRPAKLHTTKPALGRLP